MIVGLQVRTDLDHRLSGRPSTLCHVDLGDGNSGRLDLVILGAGRDGKDLGIDVSIVSPMAESHVVSAGERNPSSSLSPLAASKSMENTKVLKYQEPCHRQGLDFMPFVMETEGALGDSAFEVFKLLWRRSKAIDSFDGHAWNSRSFKSVFMQGVSSALQRACAGGKRQSSGRAGNFWGLLD